MYGLSSWYMDCFNGISFQIPNFHIYPILTLFEGQTGAEAGGCQPLSLSLLSFHKHPSFTLQKKVMPLYTHTHTHILPWSISLWCEYHQGTKKGDIWNTDVQKASFNQTPYPLQSSIFVRDTFGIIFNFYINHYFIGD